MGARVHGAPRRRASPYGDVTVAIVTGIGLVTPAGAGVAATWARWRAGESALARAAGGPWASWPCGLVGEARVGDCGDLLPIPKLAKYAGRSARLLVHAAREALDRAAAGGTPNPGPARVGLYVASGQTGLEPSAFFPALDAAWPDGERAGYGALGARPSRLIDPYFSLRTLSNLGVTFLSLMTGAEGPSVNVVHDAAAGAGALATALDDLASGAVSRAIVAAHDSWLVEQAGLGLARRGWLLPRGRDAVRPFDQGGEGLAPSEGAAVIVLDRDDAASRDAGARIEIAGAATAMPDPDEPHDVWSPGATAAALAAAGLEPGDVMLAHGTGVASLDRSEASALARAAPAAPAATSLSGIVGSLGAATALVQAVAACVMLREACVPPVAGQRDPVTGPRWAGRDTALAPSGAVTIVTRSVEGQVGAMRLRGVPSSAQANSWTR